MSVLRCAVVPAYNASARLGETLRQLAPFVDQIIVVDDGSTDGTAEVARQMVKTTVIRQRRRGPGGAVLNGLRQAKATGALWAVVVDADGQMDARKIPALIEALERHEADLARGSRLERSSGGDPMPWFRGIAARILSWPSSWCARSRIRDPLSGFVALRLSVLPRHLWRGFGYPMHLSAAVAARRGRIVHVPVPAHYPADGVSHHGLHRAPAIAMALLHSCFERLR